MKRKGYDFEAVYDVRAVRVLVDHVKDCYAALGLVHHLWSPMPKEFDDYIARPKSNHYRSLHTAVIGPEGKALEVQIRTHEMHQASELGVAAHWRYKEGSRGERSYDEKIAWLRQILEWKDQIGDAGDLAEQFRTGLFDDTIYVLTPQGRVIDLPRAPRPSISPITCTASSVIAAAGRKWTAQWCRSTPRSPTASRWRYWRRSRADRAATG